MPVAEMSPDAKAGETLEACIQRGMALLDGEFPGWEWNIDLERLNLRFANQCILGQLGGYGRMLSTLGVKEERAPLYGFSLFPCETGYRDFEKRWDALTQTWREAIITRRTGEEADTDGRGF